MLRNHITAALNGWITSMEEFMKQKGTRRRLCAVLTLLLCLQTIFSPGMPGSSASVQAASSKVQFASSLRSSVKKSAKKAGADTSRIAVAKVVNYTNIYSQADEQGTLKGRLYKGAAAYIIRTSGDFCYISSGELTGWAKKKCLVTGTEAKNLVKKNNPRVATVKSSTLNIRSAASSNSQILGELTKGTSVIVTSSSSKWVKVRLTNNDYGYIYKKYAKVESGLYSGVTIAQERKMESLLNEESAQQDANGKNEPEKAAGEIRRMSGRVKRLASYAAPKDACSACYGSLIHALSRMDEAGELRKGKTPVAIGQGYKGESGEIGIGRCTAGFSCSLKGCPPTATQMLAFLEENW